MRFASVAFEAFTVFVKRLPAPSRTVSCHESLLRLRYEPDPCSRQFRKQNLCRLEFRLNDLSRRERSHYAA
jgi:hypothetical protein